MRGRGVPLVWCNLIDDSRRTAVAILGVSFATILMFMQLGFLGAVRSTATAILAALDFDILLVAPSYLYLYDSGSLPRRRLNQCESVAGVREAIPFFVGFNSWSRRNSGSEDSRIPALRQSTLQVSQRGIFVMGFNLSNQPFRLDRLRDLRALVRPLDSPRGCTDAFSPSGLNAWSQPD